jgi:hypothetical protein
VAAEMVVYYFVTHFESRNIIKLGIVVLLP